MRPEFVRLGKLPGINVFRNCKRFPEATTRDDIVVYRFDAPLNFCSVHQLERLVIGACMSHFPDATPLRYTVADDAKRDNQDCSTASVATTESDDDADYLAGEKPFRYCLILDCSSVTALDLTAINALKRISAYYQRRGVKLIFSSWKGPQRDFLATAGTSHIHGSRSSASEHAWSPAFCRVLQSSASRELLPHQL